MLVVCNFVDDIYRIQRLGSALVRNDQVPLGKDIILAVDIKLRKVGGLHEMRGQARTTKVPI